MGKAGIKRWKGDSKTGARAQSNSRATGSSKAETARSILEVSFCKTSSWDRAFARANHTGESTGLSAAKEMQLWPKMMRELEIPVALHRPQGPHAQPCAKQIISAPKVAQRGQHTVLYPH